ncbi:MAG: hypothetical protein ABIP94_03505 [Planctomycetota bacterium]
MFQSRELASLAAANLVRAGFRPDQVRVVDKGTPDRHAFLDKRTSGAKRAMILGAAFGAIGGVVAGALSADAFGLLPAILIGGLSVAAAGALLGLCVGRATKSQVQDELEHQVDAGTVIVNVTTDSEHEAKALALLAPEGKASIVSTGASFTAAVLPGPPD